MAPDDLSTIARELAEHFFMPLPDATLFAPLDQALEGLSALYRPCFLAFRESLVAAVETTSSPFTFAHESAVRGHSQRLHSAARIRALMLEAAPGESPEQLEARRSNEARARARASMDEFMQSSSGQTAVIHDVADMLLSGISKGVLVKVSRELLLQGVVMAWGTLEVLCKDLAILILNSHPQLVKSVLEDAVAKRHFELPKLTLDTLLATRFDLSHCLGHILFADKDFSDLRRLKAAVNALFPGAMPLGSALDQALLWQLNQERHLIVHRRGIVDPQFISATGSSLQVGASLPITPDALEERFRIVTALGAVLAASIPDGGHLTTA